jgi:hypothetical protein
MSPDKNNHVGHEDPKTALCSFVYFCVLRVVKRAGDGTRTPAGVSFLSIVSNPVSFYNISVIIVQ